MAAIELRSAIKFCVANKKSRQETSIYGKNSLNIFFFGTKRPLALGLGM